MGFTWRAIVAKMAEPASAPANSPNCHCRPSMNIGSAIFAASVPAKSTCRARGSSRDQMRSGSHVAEMKAIAGS